MIYHQKQYPFYNPRLVRISMGTLDFVVNYIDMLDQTCVEFRHVHECYEIYYCLQGVQRLMIGEEVQTLTEGSFAVVSPGVYHYTLYEPSQPKQYVVFIFTPPAVNTRKSRGKNMQPDVEFLSTALKYFDDHTYCICKDRFKANHVLTQLEAEISADLPGKEQMVNSLYQAYLIAIFRNLVSDGQEEFSSSSPNLAVEITKYMHANYNRNITVQDVADAFYISPRHVNRVFEEYFGQSFKRTLNIYRINYAKNYLMDTDYSVERIAELVGFSSPKTLYQLFREHEGMTITEFRSKQRR